MLLSSSYSEEDLIFVGLAADQDCTESCVDLIIFRNWKYQYILQSLKVWFFDVILNSVDKPLKNLSKWQT